MGYIRFIEEEIDGVVDYEDNEEELVGMFIFSCFVLVFKSVVYFGFIFEIGLGLFRGEEWDFFGGFKF